MSMIPIVAPYVPTYTAHEPYVSTVEFQRSPTGVNVTQLAPGADATVNEQVLAQTIANASNIADDYCNQVLACTVDILYGEYRARDGLVLVPVNQTPLVQVNGVWIGGDAINAQDAARITFPSPNVLSIPAAAVGRVGVQVEYLAGYPNTFLTAGVVVGATTLPVTDTLGMVPGSRLTISDPGQTEIVVVESVTDTVITLTAPITKAHDPATNVGAVPPAVKQAVILIASVLIKTRGSEAVVLSSMSGGTVAKQAMDPAAATQLSQAVELLATYKRVA